MRFLSLINYILTIPVENDSHPPLPNNSRFNNQGLQDILQVCWSTNPTQRPHFSKIIVKDLIILNNYESLAGQEVIDSPRIPVIDKEPETMSFPSPDMRPTIPEHLQAADNNLCELFFFLRFSLTIFAYSG